MVGVCHEETTMPLFTPNSDNHERQEADRQKSSKTEGKQGTERIFHGVESQDGAGTDRAHIIAIWTGLFIVAIVVSQFGRPSHARQADFLRASAKVAALGKAEARAPVARQISASRMEDAKELVPAVYASHKYGVAWQYPRAYVLRKGANANLDLYGHAATESAFAGTGGVALATVIIPARAYAGTDFKSAALTARVNSQISEEGCGKFRRASFDTGEDVKLTASPETIGTIDFMAAEADAGDVADGASSTSEKFYHVYENEACYEFALRVSTSATADKPGASRVDKDDVFDRLSEILTSVTIVPVREAAAPVEAHGN
jgi:hypothetical protein